MAAQLYGDLLVKLVVCPLRKIDHTHTAGAQQALNTIRTNHLPFHLLSLGRVVAKGNADGIDYRLFNVGFNRRVGLQQAANVVTQFTVVTAG